MHPTYHTAETAEESPSILLVDDDAGILETLVDIFEDMGIDAETATTGKQALAKLEQRPYNLALLDIRLPDMQGTELLSHAKRIRPHIVCIMATGNASLPSAVEALDQGAYAYLQKPIDVADVKSRVRRAIEQQQLEVQNRRLLAQLRSLRDITDAVLSTLEPGELLEHVLDQFLRYHEADAGAIYLVDEASRSLALHSALGPIARIREGEGRPTGLVERAAEVGDVLVAFGDELEGDAAWEAGVRSSIAAPLRARGRLIGVVRLDRLSRRPYDAEEVELFRAIAERAGVLIDNARLFGEERRLRAEAEGFSSLASALVERIGLTDRLELIGHHLLQVTGTRRCFVWLTARQGLACAWSTVSSTEQERRLARTVIPMDELPVESRRILETGRPAVVAGVGATPLVEVTGAGEWDVHSALLLPLRFEGRAIGVILLDTPAQPLDLSEEQVRQATTIAFVSGGAIQQARTIQEERDTLRTLAESFLSQPPDLTGIQIAHRYEPAYEVAQIGGDYYDFIDLGPNRLGIVIGDVCGKELAAFIYTAKAKYMLRAYARLRELAAEDGSPRWVMTQLNHALYSEMSEDSMYITMVYGVLDLASGAFTYTNAGHPPPLLYSGETSKITELMPTGGMVGAMDDTEFDEATVVLPAGSILTLFTDGVTEARTGIDMMESEGVQSVILEHAAESAPAISDAIYEAARKHASGLLRDDVAIVVIKNA